MTVRIATVTSLQQLKLGMHGWVDGQMDGRTNIVWLRAQSRHADPCRRRRRRRKCHKSRHRRRDVFNTLVMNSELTPRRRWCRIICRTHELGRCSLLPPLIPHQPPTTVREPTDRPLEKSREFVSGFVAVDVDCYRRWCPNGLRLADGDEHSASNSHSPMCGI